MGVPCRCRKQFLAWHVRQTSLVWGDFNFNVLNVGQEANWNQTFGFWRKLYTVDGQFLAGVQHRLRHQIIYHFPTPIAIANDSIWNLSNNHLEFEAEMEGQIQGFATTTGKLSGLCFLSESYRSVQLDGSVLEIDGNPFKRVPKRGRPASSSGRASAPGTPGSVAAPL